MGERQHVTAVGGEAGEPVSTTEDGSIQTDNYPRGGAIEADTYPVTLNADDFGVEAIQELILSQVGEEIVREMETVQGDTWETTCHGIGGRFEVWELQRVTFQDPEATGAHLAVEWGGE